MYVYTLLSTECKRNMERKREREGERENWTKSSTPYYTCVCLQQSVASRKHFDKPAKCRRIFWNVLCAESKSVPLNRPNLMQHFTKTEEKISKKVNKSQEKEQDREIEKACKMCVAATFFLYSLFVFNFFLHQCNFSNNVENDRWYIL